MTCSSVKHWRKNTFMESWVYGRAPLCMKLVYVRNYHCCSCGRTNIYSMSWYRWPVTKHVVEPYAVISSKKSKIECHTESASENFLWRMYRNLSVHQRDILNPNMAILCVDCPIEMGMISLHSTEYPTEMTNHQPFR